MKEYSTNPENLPLIRKIFSGYIFRREENGVGYVKCIDKHASIIKSFNIEIKEV